MNSSKIRRKYSITDIKLCAIASNLCRAMDNNLEDLRIFGVTEEKIAEFRDLYQEFAYFENDIVSISNTMIATEQKKAIFDELDVSIQKMSLRFELQFGVNSLEVKSLGIKGLKKMIDDSKILIARRVLEQVNLYFGDLSVNGLTQELINEFETLINSAEAALNEQRTLMNAREVSTLKRIKIGNELYDLVVKYCKIGKKVYANKNSTYYSNYLIYS